MIAQSHHGRSVVASAQTVDLTQPMEARRQRMARREWQSKVWPVYRVLPEIRYPANYIGNALSRYTMRPGWKDPDSPTADPTIPESTKRPPILGAAEDILAELEGPQGGIGEIQRRYGITMSVSGDGWLLGLDQMTGDTSWEFVSNNEIQFAQWGAGNDERAFRNATGDEDWRREENLLPTTGIFTHRFWNAHPEFSQQADSPLETLLADAQRLIDLNDAISARILSRLASAGILFLPSSLHMPIAPSGVDDGQAEKDSLLASIITLMTTAIQERGTAASVIPILLRGPDDLGEKIRHITLDDTITDTEMQLRAELRQNITHGQDLPVEVQTEIGGASHWNTWAISDSTHSNHLQPKADSFADSLTRVFLRPALIDNGFDPAEVRSVVVIADGSNVVTRPNGAEDTRQLHDRATISDRVLRLAAGAEDADAPDEDEYVRILGRQAHDPYLATFGLPVAERIDWDKVGTGKGEGAPGIGGLPTSRRPADSSRPAGAPGDIRK